MDPKPHMVKQTITYSDGTETVINYRGVIVDGVLIEDNPVKVSRVKKVVVEGESE